jgi:thiamine monophosphate synthase
MSATMERQGGRVHLEQSDMSLAKNMAKMSKGGFSHAAIEETQQLIKKPCTEV